MWNYTSSNSHHFYQRDREIEDGFLIVFKVRLRFTFELIHGIKMYSSFVNNDLFPIVMLQLYIPMIQSALDTYNSMHSNLSTTPLGDGGRVVRKPTALAPPGSFFNINRSEIFPGSSNDFFDDINPRQ